MSESGEVLVGVVVGYLIGTFPSADLVTRAVTRGQLSIRESGSGNPGGLNAARVLGNWWGALVMFLDVAKGALAGFVGLAIGDAGAYAAGTAAIAGHVWPLWTRFRGGRGVATAGGSFAAVFPPFFVIGALFAGTTALLTRNPGLTIKLICPVWVAAGLVWWAADLDMWWGPSPTVGLVAYSVLGALMVLVRFRASTRSGTVGLG